MMPLGVWILVFPVASLLCASVTVYVSTWNRRLVKVGNQLAAALRASMEIIDCLAERGAITCDVCHRPIAPRTPTNIEPHENGWSIAHEKCVERVPV